MNHTPGPWAVDHDERPGMAWNDHIVLEADPNHRICFMTSDGNKDNARLIAAAPAYEYVWLELSSELREFVLADAPEWVRDAISTSDGEK